MLCTSHCAHSFHCALSLIHCALSHIHCTVTHCALSHCAHSFIMLSHSLLALCVSLCSLTRGALGAPTLSFNPYQGRSAIISQAGLREESDSDEAAQEVLNHSGIHPLGVATFADYSGIHPL